MRTEREREREREGGMVLRRTQTALTESLIVNNGGSGKQGRKEGRRRTKS